MNRHDLDFLKKFSMVIAFLVALTIGLIIAGNVMGHRMLPYRTTPQANAQTISRIAPVGAVFAGEEGRAQQLAADELAKKRLTANAAYGGTTDGKTIFGNLCTGCHTSGAGGAPTLDASHWGSRLAQGKDTLYKHAIEGFTGSSGVMPAKGGNPALTDEQVKATVDWMVKEATGQ